MWKTSISYLVVMNGKRRNQALKSQARGDPLGYFVGEESGEGNKSLMFCPQLIDRCFVRLPT